MPTLHEFAPPFLDGYARANRQKPSGIASKETILRVHLIPALGDRKLDAITDEQVQRLKLQLHDKAPKTVNNVLTVLNVLLKSAVAWNVIDKLPCSIRLLPVGRSEQPSTSSTAMSDCSMRLSALIGAPMRRGGRTCRQGFTSCVIRFARI